jgi:hypothetical protein
MKTAQMIENTFDDVAHRLPMSGSSVDVQRPHLADVKRRRRLLLAGTVTVLVAAATFGLSHLAPAAPEERSLLRPGSVVKADTLILHLSNPEVERSARGAELQPGFPNQSGEGNRHVVF